MIPLWFAESKFGSADLAKMGSLDFFWGGAGGAVLSANQQPKEQFGSRVIYNVLIRPECHTIYNEVGIYIAH